MTLSIKPTSLVVLVLVLLLALPLLGVQAEGEAAPDEPEEQILPAVVAHVRDEQEITVMEQSQLVQQLELRVSWGARRGDTFVVEHRVQAYAGRVPYKAGDHVFVSETAGMDGEPAYYIVGYARWIALLWIGVAFVILVLLVGRGRGARSLLGMLCSFAIIFAFMLPRLAAGRPPLTTALVGAALTLPLSYYITHGLNRKTTVALVGSIAGLAITALLALAFTEATRLSGYASDAAGFLQTLRGGGVDIKGLLWAGIIVGVLGVLDDIAVAQAGLVEQLQAVNDALSWRELYSRAMQVGQDHIASMVNTLVLVYAGSALPLLLLLSDRSLSPLYIVSHEVVAEEIVRMLVTSSGLVATVPITTLLAAAVARWRRGEAPPV